MTELLLLNLSACASLERIPDACFTGLEQLQHLNLSGCSSLTKLPDSLGDLTSLVTLDLSDCEQLQELPESMRELIHFGDGRPELLYGAYGPAGVHPWNTLTV